MKKKIKCMLCNKNEATVHFAEISNGQIHKMHICEECAHKKGIGVDISFSVADLIAGLSPGTEEEQQALRCPGCGMELAEFKNSGRLGCPKCYEAFEPVLMHIIESVHKNTIHTGKLPPNVAVENQAHIRERIKVLQDQLADAVKKEEFERAAKVRDRIKTLKLKVT